MEENNVQDVEAQETETEAEKEQEQEKKFTQEELNSIIAKEKSKWEKKAEENQTRKILEILKESENLEEAIKKIEALIK